MLYSIRLYTKCCPMLELRPWSPHPQQSPAECHKVRTMMQDFLPRMSEKKTGREEGSVGNERDFSWLCVSQRGTSVCNIANWSLFLTLQGVGIEKHSSLRQYVTWMVFSVVLPWRFLELLTSIVFSKTMVTDWHIVVIGPCCLWKLLSVQFHTKI